MINQFTVFLSGITVCSFGCSSLFFFKLFRASKDRFFLFFGLAIFLMALSCLVAQFFPASLEPLASPATEQLIWVYLIRLFAYGCIAVAIIIKNRR